MNSILQNNPFSIYDFLGYLFPGIFFITLMAVLFSAETLCVDELINTMCENEGALSKITVVNVLFFIIFSYVAGHLLSYLSSLTIERLSLWLYGYPSEFLLGQRKNVSFWESRVTTSSTRDFVKCENCKCCIWSCVKILFIRLFMCGLLLPICISTLLGNIINLKSFIVKPLDELTCSLIYERIKALGGKLGFEVPECDVDYSRISYHYYIHKQNAAFMQKINNYVALYGFLRVITLALNITTMYIIVGSVFSGIIIENVGFIMMLMLVTYISFLAYMKFYRRYTLEIFMFLVSDKDLVNEVIVPNDVLV